jgi:diguanylate cyclase (GGDEF)-like protein
MSPETADDGILGTMNMEPERPRPPRIRRLPPPPRMSAAIQWVHGLPLFGVLAAAILLLIALGVIDYMSAADLSFLVFYLGPVFLVTLRSGLWPGVLMSVAGTAVWFLANANLFQGDSGEIIPIWNLAEELCVFVFFTYILSALVESLRHERTMSRFDPLTGVANRRHFREMLDLEISRYRRYRRPFTLVYMDLDNFKAVNDLHGHAAGDALLRTVADTIVLSTRDVDTPGRLGGDEFGLLLPETGYDAAQTVLANLKARIAAEMARNGWPVTATMGTVTYADPTLSSEEMITLADRQMYAKKAEGKAGKPAIGGPTA